MIVNAGTSNPAKLEGISKAFSRFFPDVELHHFKVNAAVASQPVGLPQITRGAVTRAKLAAKSGFCDYGVGVEAGIFRLRGRYFGQQQAAVIDRTGKISLGHSASFMLPRTAAEFILTRGKELEDYAVMLTGVNAIGDKGGIVQFLTKGAISRTDLTEQCVIFALIPWLHTKVYDL